MNEYYYRALNVSYGGKAPLFVRLLQVLYALEPGTRITPETLYTRAGLTSTEFKEARRNELVRAFFKDHIITDGRGINAIYRIVDRKDA